MASVDSDCLRGGNEAANHCNVLPFDRHGHSYCVTRIHGRNVAILGVYVADDFLRDICKMNAEILALIEQSRAYALRVGIAIGTVTTGAAAVIAAFIATIGGYCK